MILSIIPTLSEKSKDKIVLYCCGLIATLRKRTCTEMARTLSVTHDKLYSALCLRGDGISIVSSILIRVAVAVSNKTPGWFTLDDTALCKPFARIIEGIANIYNSAMGRTDRGFSIVILAWTNGTIVIPLGFVYWFPKKIVGEDHYKTKLEIAKMLILKYYHHIPSKGVLMDGLYTSLDMIVFLNSHNINFNMRMPSNRIIELEDGRKVKLRDIKELKPTRNARSASIWASWRGVNVRLTSQLRKNKHDEKTLVFIVSNYDDTPKNHVQAYDDRWPQETVHRGTKQYLGLQHCQTTKLELLTTHINFVFLAYTFIQIERVKKKNLTAEAIIRSYQDKKTPSYNVLKNRFRSFFDIYI